ncbi:MAG: protease pro-enzyme activation domain-containing protein, partial [Polyangiaceae bacterium]
MLADNGTVFLNPGQYAFAGIRLGDFAQLQAISGGATAVSVAGTLSVGRGAHVLPLLQTAANLAISVLATDPEGGTAYAASVGDGSQVSALLTVPHGTLAIGNAALMTGAFAGFDVSAGNGASLVFQTGFPPAAQQPHGQQPVAGYTLPPASPVLGPVPPGTLVPLSIGLPLRNAQLLQSLVDAITDPTNASYRHWLSPADFATNYAPAAADYGELTAWATSHNLPVVTYADRITVSLVGTADEVEQAFYVNMVEAQRPDGTTFYTPDRQPSIDLSLPMQSASGFDDYPPPTPKSMMTGPPNGTTLVSADLRGEYLGYGTTPCTSLTGANQSIGIVALMAPYDADIAQYQTISQLTGVPAIRTVLSASQGGAALTPSANDETPADVELAMAMAPAATVVLYEGKNPTDTDAILEAILGDSKANQVSTSWFLIPTASTTNLLLTLASRGVSFFDGSGDNGALLPSGTGNANCYSSQTFSDLAMLPYVTTAGSTQIIEDGAQDYSTENVAIDARVGFVTGGGFFASQAQPTFQQHANDSNGELSAAFRNFPDVSIVGINLLEVTGGNQTEQFFDGTSASSPLWAGFMALVNQQVGSQGPVGYINPAVYHIGKDSTQYALSFNDVAGLSNTDACGFGYHAVAVYDLATGWGTPKCGLAGSLGSISCTPGGPQVNLQTDAANCGTCGHSCGKGTCSEGQCQAWEIATQPGTMYGLATDGNSLAWGFNGTTSAAGGVYDVAVDSTPSTASPQQIATTGPGAITPGNGSAIAVGGG